MTKTNVPLFLMDVLLNHPSSILSDHSRECNSGFAGNGFICDNVNECVSSVLIAVTTMPSITIILALPFTLVLVVLKIMVTSVKMSMSEPH